MFGVKLKSESGMVLIVSLVVTVLSTLLATSFIGAVIYESRKAELQKQNTQLLFLAEAGLERALYWLNNTDDPENPWAEDGQLVEPPMDYTSGEAANDPGMDDPETEAVESYNVWLYDNDDGIPWLPVDSFMVVSTGIVTQLDGSVSDYTISCVIAKLDGLPVPAALSIMDAADPEDEISKFQSSVWAIDGQNHDLSGLLLADGLGLPGIAVANTDIDTDTGIYIDDIAYQLDKDPTKPKRLDQVVGWIEELGGYVEKEEAIVHDPDLPQTLDPYATYFQKIALNISGPEPFIPDHLLGTPDKYQILYADLSEGNKMLAGGATGYGILILDGVGEFEMGGNATWNGLVICAKDSIISLKGGGATPAHINGGLLVANGFVEMNGTADITYCKEAIDNINAWLLLYQVYAWSGDWGVPLSEQYVEAEPTS